MITIGEASFYLDVADIDDAALERYATILFEGFDESTVILPLTDFGLYLEIEEGSIRGKGKIVAAATVLYFGIGQFGDFVQGVKEIAALSRSVMSTLVTDAPKKIGRHVVLKSKRVDAAKLGRLEALFRAVKVGALQPSEATQEAVQLLTEDDELPEGLIDEIGASIGRIAKDPQQIDWVIPSEDIVLEQAGDSSQLPHERRRLRISRVVAPARKLRVEIRKSSKNAKPTLVVVEH